MARHSCLFGSLPLLLLVVQPAARAESNWPREINADSIHLVLYQPQVDSWKDDHIEARSAVILTRNGDPQQIFGTVSISARTDVDRDARIVTFDDINVKDASFPSARALQPMLLTAVRESVRNWPRTVSLDRLLADLYITQAQTQAEAVPLKNTPPRIIFSTSPAVLILIDGEPVYRSVQGTNYTRVINTPALLLFDSSAGTFYLDGERRWMMARSLQGQWTAAVNPPRELDEIKQQLTTGDLTEGPVRAPSSPNEPPPAVYISTVPAELLISRGAPEYAPIPATGLLYVTNSDNDVFMDSQSQQYYVLLAGRWFRSRSLTAGPWEWVEGEQLPRDFSKIPPNSPKGHVLTSIPGTEQAREAVIANQIPQTATVRRSDAKLELRYDGDPQFRPIEGTNMEYAVNTASEVIHAAGRYYAVQSGVWFVADSPLGPWAVADMIPAEIYTIPPSCPLYHDRFVYVYGATPEVVYVGYTPGYVGAFVSDGVVVFGTGWLYPGWWGPYYYFGWPWTWGFGYQFSYWGGGWFWRPAGHYWWYHYPSYWQRVFYQHWNPGQRGHSRTWIRNNVNVYSRWGGNAVVSRTYQTPVGVAPRRGVRPDLYAGQDGQVYRRGQDGWYRQNNSGQWQRTAPNPSLNQQRQSRSLGQARRDEFQTRGQVPGIPRTTAPPRMATPRPQAAPRPATPRAGGRGGGRGR